MSAYKNQKRVLVVPQGESIETLSNLLRQARRQLTKGVDPCALCLNLIEGNGPTRLQSMVGRLAPEERDHAIATIYTLLLDQERRRELGAYFTPPHLVNHLVRRLQHFGLDIRTHRIHDPAAGGAAFIVPLVRHLVMELRAKGFSNEKIVASLCGRLTGMELDEGLAAVANALVRRMLREEFGITLRNASSLVTQGDSLKNDAINNLDILIGNPPYGKVGAKGNIRWRKKFSDIAGGQLNLYSMFVRQGLDRLKPGGLLGFIIPMSFIGGPEFAAFRAKITELANVLSIDLIEKRTAVFVDVIQDAAIIVLQRKFNAMKTVAPTSAVVRSDGSILNLGAPIIAVDGKPWRMPSTELVEGGFRLADYGYKATVGYLVANRQSQRLRKKGGKGVLPLIWAKAITSRGRFNHERGAEHTGKIWVRARATAPYIIRKACVVLQRTSNRKQKRRLNAAVVPQAFIDRHGGVIGENHVIFLVAGENPRISPKRLAILMNSESVNRRFESMCGTVSVSAKLLAEIDLPNPDLLADMNSENAESAIATAYARGLRGRQGNKQCSPSGVTVRPAMQAGKVGEELVDSKSQIARKPIGGSRRKSTGNARPRIIESVLNNAA